MTRIWVAGATGLVGSAICRRLVQESDFALIAPTRHELDLFDASAVDRFVEAEKPDVVIVAAARVGGIAANLAEPVRFLRENLLIQDNVMMGAVDGGVSTLMFLGSSCIYPRAARQPMREEDLMTGPLEPTNESYAIAKLTGIQLARSLEAERGVRVLLPLPCNVYGPGDHFDPLTSHVLSALVARFENARRSGDESVTVWGSGKARREFIHCDDLAEACLFLLRSEKIDGVINVGTGTDVTIADLAYQIANEVGYEGSIEWDKSKPDGMPRKVLDVSRLQGLGWSAPTKLIDGIPSVVRDFRSRFPQLDNTTL